jgi:hypothetical protein
MSSQDSQQNNQPLVPLAPNNTFTTRGFHELAFYKLSSEVIKVFLV